MRTPKTYSLRFLLGLTIPACAYLALVASSVRSHKAAIRSLPKLEAHVVLDCQSRGNWIGDRIGRTRIAAVPLPIWLIDILSLRYASGARFVNFHGTSTPNDAAFSVVARFRRAQRLKVASTALTDEGLIHLGKLTELESLTVKSGDISGKGFQYLKNCKRLTYLDLSGSRVCDAGLKYIKELASLEYLNLTGTRVTYDGLNSLRTMPALKELVMDGDAFTDTQLDHLRDSLTLCTISIGTEQTDEPEPE